MVEAIQEFKHKTYEFLQHGKIPEVKQVISHLGFTTSGFDVPITWSNWYQLFIKGEILNILLPHLSECSEIILSVKNHLTAMGFKLHHLKGPKRFDLNLEGSEFDLHCLALSLSIKKEVPWNDSAPFISFHHQIGSYNCRLSVLHGSIQGEAGSPKLFIRPHQRPQQIIPPKGWENLLAAKVSEKKNIMIAGATGSGKTTLLQYALNLMDPHDHVIIIEDTPELTAKDDWTQLALNNSLASQNINLHDLVYYSLRMKPDRIIVGEIRGKEIETLMLSLNTGHRGFLGSIHANSARDTLYRMATLLCFFQGKNGIGFNEALKLCASSIDEIIFVDKYQIRHWAGVVSVEEGQVFLKDIIPNQLAQRLNE